MFANLGIQILLDTLHFFGCKYRVGTIEAMDNLLAGQFGVVAAPLNRLWRPKTSVDCRRNGFLGLVYPKHCDQLGHV